MTRPSTRWPPVWVQLARDQGALTVLPVALNNQSAFDEVAAGRFDAARACFAERLEISAATGNPGVVGTAGIAEVYELAWRGRETDARRVAAAVAREATGAGRAGQSIWVQYCLARARARPGQLPGGTAVRARRL